MPETLTDSERAARRIQSAVRILWALALISVFGLLAALSAPRVAATAAIAVWYAAAAAVSFVLSRALGRRRPWARNASVAWALLHMATIVFAGAMGFVPILNAILGLMLLVTVGIASAFGGFD